MQPLRTNSNFVPFLDTEVDTSSCTSSSSESDELSDDSGRTKPSSLFYDNENTNRDEVRCSFIYLKFINTLSLSQPQSYFVQPQTSTSTLDTLSCFGSSSSDTVAKPTSCLFVICPSSKLMTLTWYPTKTIGQVKSELQARLGLLPSQYLLHIKGSKMLSEDSCSLSDYGIHKNANLEVLLPLRGGPSKVEELVVDIDERLKNKISELDSEHGLQLHKRSDEEMAVRLRDMSNRKIVMKAFNIQLNERRDDQSYRQLKRDELINSFILQRDAGFPLLKWSLMSPAERQADKRAKRSSEKKQEDNDKAAKHNAQVRANETEEETLARQENVAKQMARARADKKNVIAHNWPTLATMLGDEVGKDYKLDNHTDDVTTSLFLFHLKSGEWMFWESEWMIAFLHVLQRLGVMSKLNSLLELCLERRSTLLKTLYQAILGDNDLKQVQDWIEQDEERLTFTWEEAVLVWFATNDSISLEDRKAKLRAPEDIEIEKKNKLIQSLVGLHLNVSAYWWPGWNGEKKWTCVIESINLEDEKERYFNIKCLDHDPNDPHQEQRYAMAYIDVKNYADREQPEFSSFYLPKTLDECVDLEFKARCEKTLQELRRYDLH